MNMHQNTSLIIKTHLKEAIAECERGIKNCGLLQGEKSMSVTAHQYFCKQEEELKDSIKEIRDLINQL